MCGHEGKTLSNCNIFAYNIFDYCSIYRITQLLMHHLCFSCHPPHLVVCRQVHKASTLKEYTGQHLRNSSRNRLVRVRRFITVSDEAPMDGLGPDQTDYTTTRVQVGAPFARLLSKSKVQGTPSCSVPGVHQSHE